MPLPQIVDLTALYCGEGNHDKVYAAVLTRDQDGLFELTTVDGRRGKLLSRRSRAITKSIYSVQSMMETIVREKKVKYKVIDWSETFYGLVNTILAIGSPVGTPYALKPTKTTASTSSVPIVQPLVTVTATPKPAVSKVTPVVKKPPLPAKKQESKSPWSTARDGIDRDFS